MTNQKDDQVVKDLQDEIEKLQAEEVKSEEVAEESADQKLEAVNEKYLRLAAEFENYKRRTQEEKTKFFNQWAKWILEIIIPFLDNTKRALESCPEDLISNDWVCGIFAIEKNLVTDLEKKWLKKIKAKWEKFSVSKMEALMQDPSVKKEIVAQVLEEGYEFKWDVVRHAKVSVGTK